MQHAPKATIESVTALLAPGLFIILWSSGFIGAKYGLPYAEPFTFLTIRMIVVVALLAIIMVPARLSRPPGTVVGHNIVSGLLVHGCYLGGVFMAIVNGLPTGLVALIVSLQPVLTSTVANRLLGERVTPLQWTSFALGVAGVYLVVHEKLAGGDTAWPAWPGITVALIGITAGTLYQKRFGGGLDWRMQFLIQYGAAGLLFAAAALLFENRVVEWNLTFVFALAWMVLVMSFAAIWLFYYLIKRTATTRLTSLLYLMPPVTALMGWTLFDERLAPLALVGMAFCVVGVFLVNRA
jgi:drug/metabolite transporter (DMT)-like permease